LQIVLTNPYTYAIADLGNGHYQLTVNGSNNLTIGTHNLYLFADWGGEPYYTNRTLTLSQLIEPIDTSFITNYQGILPYGNEQNITIQYEITDPDSEHDGDPINGADVNITTLTYGTEYIVNAKGNGYYDIIILNSTLNSVTDYVYTINASKAHHISIERGVSFSVRQLRTFMSIDPIGIVFAGDDVLCDIEIKISDSESLYHDNEPLDGLTQLNFTIYNSTGAMAASEFYITPLGSGQYRITLYNTSFLPDQGYEINVSITLNSSLRDNNKNVSFSIRKTYTGLTANPMSDIPYGNEVNTTIYLGIEDPDSSKNGIGITGLTTANFTVNGTWSVGSLTPTGTDGEYILVLTNTSDTVIQNYIVNLTYTGNQTIYSDSVILDYNIRKLNTLVINDPVLPVAWNVTFNMTIYYTVDDSQSDLNNAGVNDSLITCILDSVPLTAGDFIVYFMGNGEYKIELNTSVIQAVKTYTIQINASHENIDNNYQNATYTFTFDTKSHDTSFVYDQVAVTPHLDNVTIRVTYWDLTDDEGIDNSSTFVRLSCRVAGETIQYWVSDAGNGEYDIFINSTNLAFGSYTAEVNISYIDGDKYINRTIPINPGISFEVHQVNTFYSCSFNRSNTQIIETSYSGWPWGVNLSIFVSYIDLDHSGTFVYPSSINVTGNYEFSNGGNYTINDYANGTYEILINTSAAINLGNTFRFNITLFTTSNSSTDSFTHQNFSVIFTVRKPLTRLDLSANSVEVPWNDNATVYATYVNTEEIPEANIAGAILNLTCTVGGSPTYKGIIINNWISWTPNVSTPGVYDITLNSSWVDVKTLEIKVEVEAEHLQTQKASNFYIITVNFIHISLDKINGTTEIESETDEFFVAYFRLTDIDNNANVTNNSISAYENVTFYSYYGSTYNLTGWEYGDFTITSFANGVYLINFTFLPGTVIDNYDLRIKANGSRLQGYQTGDGLAESQPFYTINIQLHTHQSGITINRTEMLNGQLLFPQVVGLPTPTFVFGNETITYGENINVTFYWFDYNHSSIGSEPNKTGITTWEINSTWESAHYRLYNMYTYSGFNESYKGIFVFEIRTSTYNQYQPFTPIVGNHTINVSMSLLGAGYSTEYTQSYFLINLTVEPINTTLNITQYTLFSGTEIQEPIVPWGGPAYYMGVYLNYTDNNSNFIDIAESVNVTFNNGTHDLMWGNNNNTIKRFNHELSGLHFVKIYTLTDDSIDASWVNGFKNFTLNIIFNRTNYASANYSINFSITQHETYIENEVYTESNKYLTGQEITFYYIDNNSVETAYERNITDFEVYCNWTGYSINTITPGTYTLIIPITYNVGSYKINLTLTDNLTYGARATATILLNLTVLQANISATAESVYQFFPLNRFFIYQGGSVTYEVSVLNEFGAPISATVTWTLFYGDSVVASGTLQQISTGNFKGDIIVLFINPDSHRLVIDITPTDTNYAPITQEKTLFFLPFWSHPLFIILMTIVSGVLGYIAYHQIKWWRTPAVVKTIIKTEKSIKKHKDIDPAIATVKSRKTVYLERFDESWSALGLKVPEMVSMEIIAASKILSDVKRSRITVNETIKFLTKLKGQGSIEEANEFLEKEFLPPNARKQLLNIAGLVKTEKEEIREFMERLNDLKAREYKYEEVELLYRQLKQMKPTQADELLWTNYLIHENERDVFLKLANVPFDKSLRKKREKRFMLLPMTSTQIKRELKKIHGLNLFEKREYHDRIMKLEPNAQRKFLKELITRHAKKDEKRIIRKAQVNKLDEEQILAELNKIPHLSDDDKINYLDALSLLPLKSQKTVLKKIKDTSMAKAKVIKTEVTTEEVIKEKIPPKKVEKKTKPEKVDKPKPKVDKKTKKQEEAWQKRQEEERKKEEAEEKKKKEAQEKKLKAAEEKMKKKEVERKKKEAEEKKNKEAETKRLEAERKKIAAEDKKRKGAEEKKKKQEEKKKQKSKKKKPKKKPKKKKSKTSKKKKGAKK